VRALKRIFVMCDADKDGALSDQELNTFQQICFNMALTDEELQNVKQVGRADRLIRGLAGRLEQ
jgi:Ras family protein T1